MRKYALVVASMHQTCLREDPFAYINCAMRRSTELLKLNIKGLPNSNPIFGEKYYIGSQIKCFPSHFSTTGWSFLSTGMFDVSNYSHPRAYVFIRIVSFFSITTQMQNVRKTSNSFWYHNNIPTQNATNANREIVVWSSARPAKHYNASCRRYLQSSVKTDISYMKLKSNWCHLHFTDENIQTHRHKFHTF